MEIKHKEVLFLFQMVDWVDGFISPIVQLVVIGGGLIFIGWLFVRAFNKVWKTQWKWILKYRMPFKKKQYDPKTIKWIMDAINMDWDYYKTKKLLLVKGFNIDRINETMWIFEQVQKQIKGGEKNGQRFARSNSKTQRTETSNLPSF